MKDIINLQVTERIQSLRHKTIAKERFISLAQARIVTEVYKENEWTPVILKRAMSLARALREIEISIDPEELIVGNRTPDIRAGVVFPEAGVSWFAKEIETLPSRPQDPFNLKKEDAAYFIEVIKPYWKGKTLEDNIYREFGDEIRSTEKVFKINQKDHAQGHICPNVTRWLKYGPAGLLRIADGKFSKAGSDKEDFYKGVILSLEASCDFIRRYSDLALEMAEKQTDVRIADNLKEISVICRNISQNPPVSFREALQSLWFLFVILQMESNASSFSPGRVDQYLYPFYINDIRSGIIDDFTALELIDALYIKFNQIVYLRNAHSAKYFAGFPTGFNIAVGGVTKNGADASNRLSWLFLKAHDHVRLPQPNLTARISRQSSDEFLGECTRIISIGTGMPQIVNDESIIPALEVSGMDHDDAIDYAVVGCVELSSQGNFLGWSDAAMFNMVKVLELTLNNGICMLSGEQTGLKTGTLTDFEDYDSIEKAFGDQIDFFVRKMIKICEGVEKYHQKLLPSPFLSSVIDDCIENGTDVTAGGAKYNFSGIQAIQVANIADSLEVISKLVFNEQLIAKWELLEALRHNFEGNEILRQICIHKAPKYGNDIAAVDEKGRKWVSYFAEALKKFRNYRSGDYHMGLYTVSAHVPMGSNVAATPDGRHAGYPLADGGVSPMYGQDKSGPTAVLNSVSRLPFLQAPNGTLLNMKFLPSFFRTEEDRKNFCSFLRAFIELKIHHIQFNVISREELIKAKYDPDAYRSLIVRVAGYTAYFTELADDLQNEIIQRTEYGEDR